MILSIIALCKHFTYFITTLRPSRPLGSQIYSLPRLLRLFLIQRPHKRIHPGQRIPCSLSFALLHAHMKPFFTSRRKFGSCNQRTHISTPTLTIYSVSLHLLNQQSTQPSIVTAVPAPLHYSDFESPLMPPINRNFQFDAPVYDRLCLFCVKSAYGRFIEDEYHACVF